MGRILYTTHDRESVLQDGVIFGKVNYNNRQKGLAERWPLIYAQVGPANCSLWTCLGTVRAAN